MGFQLFSLRRNPLPYPLIFPYKEEVGGSSPSTPTKQNPLASLGNPMAPRGSADDVAVGDAC